MKGRERNAAFFQQHDNVMVGRGGKQTGTASASNNVKTLLKRGRSTGAVILTDKKLTEIPVDLYSVEQDLEDGEKFWEIQPVVKVDLSNNIISEIPDDIAALANMTTFKIRKNNVCEVSEALFSTCIGLVHLDLSSNAITHLSPKLGQLTMLSELFINGNKLTALPDSVCDCTRLTVLEAADNRLEVLPTDIGRLQHLIRASFANNRISCIPNSLCAISSLQDLDIKKNNITFLPDLRQLSSLIVFEATDNKLNEYPSFPGTECGTLARIYLGGNRIRYLPESSFAAGENSLIELDVQGNLLTEISPDVGVLKNLKLLNASNNNLTDIPYTIGYMNSLQRILLDGNPMRSIRRSLLTQSTTDLKRYLRTRGPEPDYVQKQEASYHFADISPFDERLREMSGGILNCSGLSLSGLPSDFLLKLMRATAIDSMETSLHLLQLNLSNNKFISIPAEITEANTLQVLNMSGNMLGQSHPHDLFPESCQFPSSLRVLNVCKNGLSVQHVDELISIVARSVSLPHISHHEHGKQSRVPFGLQSLLCSENRLMELPRGLALLTGTLRELQVSFNSLTNLSNVDFRLFERLEIFDGSNNKLQSLGNLASATNLSDVLLSNNNIPEIPLEFGKLKKIRNLSVMGNPQKTVRLHVVQQGTEAILKVLRLRLPDQDQQNEGVSCGPTNRGDGEDSGYCAQDLPKEIRSKDGLANRYPPAPAAGSRGGRNTFIPPPPAAELHRLRGQESGAVVPLREALGVRGVSATAGDHMMGGASIMSASRSSPDRSDTDIDMKIVDLERQFQDLSATLDDPGMSEAKRFAAKKNLARLRANILRLRREKDDAGAARYT